MWLSVKYNVKILNSMAGLNCWRAPGEILVFGPPLPRPSLYVQDPETNSNARVLPGSMWAQYKLIKGLILTLDFDTGPQKSSDNAEPALVDIDDTRMIHICN